MANLLSNTTVGGSAVITTSNIGSYALTSIPATISPTNVNIGNAIYFGAGNNYLNWDGARINSNVGIQSTSDMRAPIFYDSSNTGYYGDFASTSNLYKLQLGGGSEILGLLGMGANYWYGMGVSSAYTAIYSHFQGNGVALGAYNGTTFTPKLYVGNDGNVEAVTSLRAPIFYDSNDTGYYLDPNGLSVLSHIRLNNNWANAGINQGAINIRGQYPSMQFRNTVSDSMWLRHMDASGTIQHYYASDGVDSSNWSIKHSMFGNGNFSSVGTHTASQFIGSGAGLTGTASSLSVNYATGAGALGGYSLDTMKKYIWSRGENLLSNGTGLMGNNTNFSSFTFDGSQAYFSSGSFRYTGQFQAPNTDELMPVNPEKRYRLDFWARTTNGQGAYYAYLNFFDVDGNTITAVNHMYYANTLTTLAQTLNPGDTVVYLTSAANWENGGTAGVSTHIRSFIFWNYVNSFGYLYPPETYSQNWYGGRWDPGAVNYSNNTITLISPWNGPSIAAGTKLSNGSAGGTFKYIALGYTIVPTTWTNYVGIMDGVDYSGTNAGGKFPPGTASAKLGFLTDYNASGDTIFLANLFVGVDNDYPIYDRWTGSTRIEKSGAFYGTIFYDSNDSSFYLNPNATSRLSVLNTTGSITTDGYLYTNSSTRIGEIWGYGGVYKSSGEMMFGTEGYGWRWHSGNVQKAFLSSDGFFTTAGGIRVGSGDLYLDQNYGRSVVGVYSSYRYQGVFAMGDSYKLPADGTSTGSLYGIAWTHTNVGGQSKSGLDHQALFVTNGNTQTAIGTGIWTAGLITTTSYGTSANWNTAYSWGNHASAGYLTGAHNHDDRYYTESEIDSQIGNRLYQARVNGLNVNSFNATGIYRGSTSDWSNRPTITHNGGALLTIDTHPSEYHSQLFFDTGGDRLYFRNANGGSWGSWLTMFHSGNYTSYVPTLTGTGASGTWNINVTGSAGSASTATTATNLYGAGGSNIRSSTPGTSYQYSYQVREKDGGYGNSTIDYAPQLAFHWGNVVASSILMEASGRMSIRNNPGTGYENFIAAVIYSSGYGDSTQWNTAYSWGNHASAGYQSASTAITTSNIGSQSVSYASTAGALTSMNISQFSNNSGYLTSLPSHNHDDRYLVKGGSWYGVGLPGSRWGGFTVNGGEIVFGDGLPNAGQMGMLIDGAYLAGENNGFWSLPSDNVWSGRRGMYWNGTYLDFTTNSPTAQFTTLRLANGFELQQGGSDYGRFSSWVFLPGAHGLYSSISGAHFYPNTNSYGSWVMEGSRNGWQGIEFRSGSNGAVTLMINADSNTSGFHNNSYGWQFRWNNGTLYCHKNAYGGGTEATVLDSSNYSSWAQPIASAINTGNIGSQSVSYASSAGSAGSVSGLTLTSSANGINPDSVTQNQIGYNTSVSLFGQTDGGLYSSAYSSAWIHQIYGDFRTGQIAVRGKNSGSWQSWRTVLDSGNYTSYSPSLTGSGASGTWGINVTGSAGSVAASGITGQSGMWTSAARPGAYRLYRNDDDSAYNVQTTWTADKAGHWSLRGYYNDSYHAPCYVASSGYADSAGAVAWTNVSSRPTALSQFSNDLGNYGGWITSSGSISGNAATATNVAWTGVTGRPTALSQFSNDLGNYGGFLTSLPAHDHDRVFLTDSRGAVREPSYYDDRYAQWDFQNNGDTNAGGDAWHGLLTVSKWTVYDGSHRQEQLAFTGDDLKRRTAASDSAWGPWKTILDSNNFSTWAAAASHTHSIANVTGLQTALDGKQASGSYLTTSGKAADSELIDGIDSSRIVYGNGARGKSINMTSGSANTLDSANASGFYYGNAVTGMPTGDWWNWLSVTGNDWATSDGYGYQMAGSFWSDDFRIRRLTSGSWASWVNIIHSGNIGSQSVNYASSAGSAGSATSASQLNKYGDIYGQDWNGYYLEGKFIAAAVYGMTGPNKPPTSYDYGVALSYGESTGPRLQWYFPENQNNVGTIFRKGTYRTGWNGNWSTWKTLVEQEGNLCTIVGGNGTGLEVHGNVGYNQDPLTYFLIRGQADTSWKAVKIRLTGDAGGQDIEFRRIAENGADSRMWYVPRGGNTVNFEYPIVQPSDSRLKDNITPISTPVEKIKALSGVEFDWNSGEQVGTHDVGLIAQDVEAVLPEAVTTQEDGYKNLSYTKVIPLLVEAMKEQQTMIEALRAEIELLKNK